MNGTQLALDFTHREENNHDSRRHLEENRERFSAQCQQVYDLLRSGVRLTVLSAITEYGISSLPRRILDLKEHFREESGHTGARNRHSGPCCRGRRLS